MCHLKTRLTSYIIIRDVLTVKSDFYASMQDPLTPAPERRLAAAGVSSHHQAFMSGKWTVALSDLEAPHIAECCYREKFDRLDCSLGCRSPRHQALGAYASKCTHENCLRSPDAPRPEVPGSKVCRGSTEYGEERPRGTSGGDSQPCSARRSASLALCCLSTSVSSASTHSDARSGFPGTPQVARV